MSQRFEVRNYSNEGPPPHIGDADTFEAAARILRERSGGVLPFHGCFIWDSQTGALSFDGVVYRKKGHEVYRAPGPDFRAGWQQSLEAFMAENAEAVALGLYHEATCDGRHVGWHVGADFKTCAECAVTRRNGGR